MKTTLKYGIAALAAMFGLSACVQDLNVHSIDPNVAVELDESALLGKIYNTLGTTGQTGPDGNGDIADLDEGTSSFYRMTYSMNEYPSDQIYWIWPDVGVSDLRAATWNSSNALVKGAYTRLFFDITLCNAYIDAVKEKGDYDEVKFAEVRFLRALNYWYLLDMYGNVPFNIASSETYEHADRLVGSNDKLPKQIKRDDLYEWVVKELEEVEPVLSPAGSRLNQANNMYYRVDQAAAWILLSRLYLNSGVYSSKGGTAADYTKAAQYAKKAIDSNYELAPVYRHLFMGDNDNLGGGAAGTNQAYKEIILPVNQDGLYTQSWGGSMYLIAAYYTSGMPSWGITESWKCIRTREELVKLFFPNAKKYRVTATEADAIKAEIEGNNVPAGTEVEMCQSAADDRALFCNYYVSSSGVYAPNMGAGRENADDKFLSGWGMTKFNNLMVDANRKPNDSKHPDMDIPLIRLAEAYLTYAEAVLRGGATDGMSADDAINAIRNRAHAATKSGYTLDDVLDEWGREYYAEGRRRVDLIRFGKFTGSSYSWELKNDKVYQGSIEEFRSIFPIPESDRVANSNLVQNPGY